MSDVNEKKLAMLSVNEDGVLPFQLEASGVRGRLVRLGSAIDTLLRAHDYPTRVGTLLGETTALAAALGTALKFDGVFTVQARTDGPVSLLVADVTSDGALRAYAQFDALRVAEVIEGKSLVGLGTLVFTVDPHLSKDRYQGVVALEGEGLTEAFQTYFRQSEQIPTGLIAAAGRDETGAWHAACLMIQRMPREGGTEVQTDTSQLDDWHRVMSLMQTCTKTELLDPSLAPEALLYRLFHEEGVRVYDALGLRHECRCSQEKIAKVLAGMPMDEIKAMLVDDQISVTCQFCSTTYTFDEKDVDRCREEATFHEGDSETAT